MVVKTSWENIGAVVRDMTTCMYDLQDFTRLYKEENMPPNWDKFIKEGFRGMMVSLFELCKSYIIHANKYSKINGMKFVDILEESVNREILLEDSIVVLETLRQLRNDNSHGYDVPDFTEIFNFYVDYKYIFEDILDRAKILYDNESKTNKLNL